MLMSMPDQPRHVQPFQKLEPQSMELLCSVAQCRAQQLHFTCKTSSSDPTGSTAVDCS